MAVNGTTVATGIPLTAASSTLTGAGFYGDGTVPVGDDILIDDFLLTNS